MRTMTEYPWPFALGNESYGKTISFHVPCGPERTYKMNDGGLTTGS